MRASAISTVLLYGAAAWAATSKDSNDDEKEKETPSKTEDDKASETSSDSVTTHTIAVGASGHKFTPGEVDAKVGDIIEWRFYPVEHWVIRGDFDYPCVPYDYIGTDRKSFDSGAQTVQAITDDGPRYRIRVNNTDPIYYYCGAPGSCERYHMMGIINPWKNQTLKDWQDLAKDVDYQLRPGDPWPSEAAIPSDAPKGHTDKEGDSESSTDKDKEKQEEDGDGDGGLSGGAIAGIVVGSVAAVALIALVALLCFRRRGLTITRKNENRQSTANTVHTRPGHMSEATYSSVPSGGWTAQTSPYSQHQQTFHQGAGYQQAPYQPTGSVSPPPVHGGELMSPNMPYPGPTSPYQEQYGTGYYNSPQAQTKPEVVPPAELPTSNDPGNSPIPPYRENNRFSWTGPEAEYRPSKQGAPEQ